MSEAGACQLSRGKDERAPVSHLLRLKGQIVILWKLCSPRLDPAESLG